MSNDKPSLVNGTDPLQRLASFKPPRDLSLGGGKTSKKVFAPNLNVIRNKNKGVSPIITKSDKKGDRNDRRHDRNRNTRSSSSIIKSSGVFSEGLGSIERHSSRISYGRDTESAPVLKKPVIRVKDVIKIDRELEDEKIKSLLNGNSEVDEEENYLHINIMEKDAPIKLPLDNGFSTKSKQETKLTREPIVKMESTPDIANYTEDVKPDVNQLDIKEDVFEDFTARNILRNTEPTLLLLQLPDTLPGRGVISDEDLHKNKQKRNEPSTSNAEPITEEDKPMDNRCRLADLEEGRIGKIVVHRSGRVKLMLGDSVFEVCAGTKSSFHQEVVSIGVDDETRSANMIGLGPIKHKLDLIPDWETLFSDMGVD